MGTNDGNTNIRYLDNFNPTQILTYNNKNEISGWAMPSDKYIDLTLGASGSTYTAPANGWVHISMTSSASGQYLDLFSGYGGFQISSSGPNYVLKLMAPVAKGKTWVISYHSGLTLRYFRFIYAVGSESEAS